MYFSVLKAETWKQPDKSQSYILYGRRRNTVNTNTVELFPLLTTSLSPLNALFWIAITCHFPLSYTQNQYHPATVFLSTTDHEEYIEDSCTGETCQDWQLRAQELYLSTEQVCGQAAGMRSALHLLISAFSASLPCSASSWAGKRTAWEEPPIWAPFLCQKGLAASQGNKHLTTATAKHSEHVNSFYSHPSRGIQKAKNTLVISLVLWISTPPGLQHIFGLCVHSVLASAVWETLTESQ